MTTSAAASIARAEAAAKKFQASLACGWVYFYSTLKGCGVHKTGPSRQSLVGLRACARPQATRGIGLKIGLAHEWSPGYGSLPMASYYQTKRERLNAALAAVRVLYPNLIPAEQHAMCRIKPHAIYIHVCDGPGTDKVIARAKQARDAAVHRLRRYGHRVRLIDDMGGKVVLEGFKKKRRR